MFFIYSLWNCKCYQFQLSQWCKFFLVHRNKSFGQWLIKECQPHDGQSQDLCCYNGCMSIQLCAKKGSLVNSQQSQSPRKWHTCTKDTRQIQFWTVNYCTMPSYWCQPGEDDNKGLWLHLKCISIFIKRYHALIISPSTFCHKDNFDKGSRSSNGHRVQREEIPQRGGEWGSEF